MSGDDVDAAPVSAEPLLEVVLELAAPGRVAQLAERLGLDLADALAGDVELLADLLEGAGTPVLEAEPELEHAPLATGQRVKDRLDLLLEELMRRRLGRGERAPVLDEVAEVGVLLLADRGLERDRLLRDLDDLADLLGRDLDLLALRHGLGDLLDRRLTAQLLKELARDADQPVDRLDHVDRDADRPRLVRDRARDRLPDPPRGVGGELVAAAVLELVDGLHQADVAFLDQIEELQATVGVLLGDRDDETEVGLDQLLLRLLGLRLALRDRLERAHQLLGLLLELRRH